MLVESIGQLSQCLEPAVAENLPGSQLTHGPGPHPVLYVPVGHPVHPAPPLAAVYPSLHKHAAASVEATGEIAFASQSTQGLSPVTFLYLPAAQYGHTVAPGAPWRASALYVCPALHMQDRLVLAAYGSKPLGSCTDQPGHTPQAAIIVAPDTAFTPSLYLFLPPHHAHIPLWI